MNASRWLLRFSLLAILLAAFTLRLQYAIHSHPFYDEYTTVLAGQAILQQGWPVLPSGLFYEHGLVATYLAAPFVALATPVNETLFPLVRMSGLAAGLLTVALLYAVGRRGFSPQVGLLAAILLTLSPEGVVWGGRVRMYALAQLLVLLTVWLTYTGIHRDSWRRLTVALVSLLLTLLTQFAALALVPPLLVAATWLAWRQHGFAGLWHRRLRFSALLAGLGGVLGIGVLVKRLGQPLGMAQLGSNQSESLLNALWTTLAYQLGLVLDQAAAIRFLGRQFGVPHHLWLSSIVLLGLVLLGLYLWQPASQRPLRQAERRRKYAHLWQFDSQSLRLSQTPAQKQSYIRVYAFVALVFGLFILEMITVIEPFRRNPRYVVMALPLFYLLVAAGFDLLSRTRPRELNLQPLSALRFQDGVWILAAALIITLTGLHLNIVRDSLTLVFETPEPAYEAALAFVASEMQADDPVLSMHASAIAVQLPTADFYYAIQNDADQFLLNNARNGQVDRWLGAPWIGDSSTFRTMLNQHQQIWFIVDTIRLPVYYRGAWLALLETQMDLVWAEDEALVYRSRPDRIPLPDTPAVTINAHFESWATLQGYTLTPQTEALSLALFWQVENPPPDNYTLFLHLRNANGETIRQWDRQPFAGRYPTGQWQTGETLTELMFLPLSAEELSAGHHLALGWYNLETLTRLPLRNDQSGENALYLPLHP